MMISQRIFVRNCKEQAAPIRKTICFVTEREPVWRRGVAAIQVDKHRNIAQPTFPHAFSIPIIQLMTGEQTESGKRRIKTLIVTPTRELAIQIGDNIS